MTLDSQCNLFIYFHLGFYLKRIFFLLVSGSRGALFSLAASPVRHYPRLMRHSDKPVGPLALRERSTVTATRERTGKEAPLRSPLQHHQYRHLSSGSLYLPGVASHNNISIRKMSIDTAKLDDHIERLRKGDTLTENEVKALCEKV